jgi:hypothetical protein
MRSSLASESRQAQKQKEREERQAEVGESGEKRGEMNWRLNGEAREIAEAAVWVNLRPPWCDQSRREEPRPGSMDQRKNLTDCDNSKRAKTAEKDTEEIGSGFYIHSIVTMMMTLFREYHSIIYSFELASVVQSQIRSGGSAAILPPPCNHCTQHH